MEETKTALRTVPQVVLFPDGKFEAKGLDTEQLQQVIDASVHVINYRRLQQEYLTREANRTAIYLGLITSFFAGLIVFLVLNTIPQEQANARPTIPLSLRQI